MELRTREHEGQYADWRILVVAVKAAATAGFVAVDDFVFRPSDMCEMLPPDHVTTPRPDCGFQCDDGSCVSKVWTNTLGWSVLRLFGNFLKRAHYCRSGIVTEFNSKISTSLTAWRMRGKVFIFLNSQGP